MGLDGLTYAARPSYLREWLQQSANAVNAKRFTEVIADIRDAASIGRALRNNGVTDVVHLAAESHVCKSIAGPRAFYETNVMGTFNLIDEFRLSGAPGRFLHVSTDEVFGELPLDPKELFNETWPLSPRSPYAASKAASEHVVRVHAITYGLDAVITNCTNNFGENQHEEKLIPKTVRHLLRGERPKLYMSGMQVRDWLHVDDHAHGLLLAFERGKSGESYCFGGNHEMSNAAMVDTITAIMGSEIKPEVTLDRPTDDLRYAVDCSKAKRDLGWEPTPAGYWGQKLRETVAYYAGGKNVRNT